MKEKSEVKPRKKRVSPPAVAAQAIVTQPAQELPAQEQIQNEKEKIMTTATTAAPAVHKAKKAPVEKITIAMLDGRAVEFTSKQSMKKEDISTEHHVRVRFDFRNGETRVFTAPGELLHQLASFGARQTIGDVTAGVENIDDAVAAVESRIKTLESGVWGAERGVGESFSGAALVIKAIVEVSQSSKNPRDAEFVKNFLDKKLAKAAAEGTKLSRQALYAFYRDPTTATGRVVARLEAEQAAKKAKTGVDIGALVGDMDEDGEDEASE